MAKHAKVQHPKLQPEKIDPIIDKQNKQINKK